MVQLPRLSVKGIIRLIKGYFLKSEKINMINIRINVIIYNHPLITYIPIDGMFMPNIILFPIVSMEFGYAGALYFCKNVGCPFFLFKKSNIVKLSSIEVVNRIF